MRAAALAWLIRSHGSETEDGELPAMIEMVKTGRGSRLERFAVRLVLGAPNTQWFALYRYLIVHSEACYKLCFQPGPGCA